MIWFFVGLMVGTCLGFGVGAILAGASTQRRRPLGEFVVIPPLTTKQDDERSPL